MLLNRAFGIKTLSLYDNNHDIGARPDLSYTVGHRAHGMDADEFCAHARRSEKTLFVKTDELPSDNAKTIYLVRDGHAAIISYYHSARRALLRDLIVGKLWPNSWSSHVNTWALSGRPNTLVLRYKDLVADNTQYLMRIADFIGLPKPKNASVDFAQLQEQFPKFFRSGSNEKNVAELKGDDLRLFWTLHGETMERMGYADRIAKIA
jgi:hypothetical protein